MIGSTRTGLPSGRNNTSTPRSLACAVSSPSSRVAQPFPLRLNLKHLQGVTRVVSGTSHLCLLLQLLNLPSLPTPPPPPPPPLTPPPPPPPPPLCPTTFSASCSFSHLRNPGRRLKLRWLKGRVHAPTEDLCRRGGALRAGLDVARPPPLRAILLRKCILEEAVVIHRVVWPNRIRYYSFGHVT